MRDPALVGERLGDSALVGVESAFKGEITV